MKKFGFVIFTVAALLIACTGQALAGSGPHGGGYTATTDACAGCHRAHTALQGNLLLNPTEQLCLTCHGSTAAGAQTNVTDGVYGQYRDTDGSYTNKTETGTEGTIGGPLNGGGFAYYRNQGQASFMPVTSTHDVSGSATAAWGLGDANTGQTGELAAGLTCGTCHDPHGSSNYRILRTSVNGHDVNVSSLETAWSYTSENWGNGISAFCSACHEAYSTGGPLNAGGVIHFRHDIDMNYQTGENVNPEVVGFGGYTLPLANSGQGDLVVCTTCHLPHGTSALQGVNSTDANIAGDSSLLRLDNRGVCEVCHQK